jgi:hypothetical protein
VAVDEDRFVARLPYFFSDAADAPSGESQLVVSNPVGQIFYTTSINPFAILATACPQLANAGAAAALRRYPAAHISMKQVIFGCLEDWRFDL